MLAKHTAILSNSINFWQKNPKNHHVEAIKYLLEFSVRCAPFARQETVHFSMTPFFIGRSILLY